MAALLCGALTYKHDPAQREEQSLFEISGPAMLPVGERGSDEPPLKPLSLWPFLAPQLYS